MSTPPFDVAKANRWFAVEMNNLAWDLVEKAGRSGEEEERMIHAAHGAWVHWKEVGDVVNRLRAEVLLGTVYVQAGRAEEAVRHAERALAASGEAGEKQSDFDRATVHACARVAYVLAGREEEGEAQAKLLRRVMEKVADAEEVKVVERLYLK